MVTESGVFVQTKSGANTLSLCYAATKSTQEIKVPFRFNWNVWYILVWKTVPCFHVITTGYGEK